MTSSRSVKNQSRTLGLRGVVVKVEFLRWAMPFIALSIKVKC